MRRGWVEALDCEPAMQTNGRRHEAFMKLRPDNAERFFPLIQFLRTFAAQLSTQYRCQNIA